MPRFQRPETSDQPLDLPEQSDSNPTDPSLGEQLRPKSLDEIIGQSEIKLSLSVFIQSAVSRGTAMDHVLLTGRPGLGKTTFALAIAHDLNRPVLLHDGPAFSKEAIEIMVGTELNPNPNILNRFMRGVDPPKTGAVVLVDEVHALPRDAYEVLYPLMEDYKFHGIKIPAFTLVGATTDPGKLPHPFRDRFGIRYTIDYYNQTEILEILVRSYTILAPTDEPVNSLTNSALESIAERSRGTPRTANRLLRRCLDYSHVRKKPLDPEIVQETMTALDIDSFGLETVDRKILISMVQRFDRPVGLAAIAAAIGEDTRSIEQVHEPWLVRAGYIDRTRSGRVLTPDGKLIAAMAIEGRVSY
jgi:holliday junction DNA helicase RuvB